MLVCFYLCVLLCGVDVEWIMYMFIWVCYFDYVVLYVV